MVSPYGLADDAPEKKPRNPQEIVALVNQDQLYLLESHRSAKQGPQLVVPEVLGQTTYAAENAGVPQKG